MSDSSILPDAVAKALDLLSDYIMQYEGQHDDESDARAAFKVIDRYTRQRDAAVRARALEDAARDIKALTVQSSFNDWDDGYNAALKTAASDVLSLIPTPPAPALDEAKSRVIGSVIDGTNAQAGVHQVTTHETGGVTDPIPGANDEAAIRAELVEAARNYIDGWDDCENTSDDKLNTLFIVLRAALAKATS